ncbi:hypothetical protein ATANTOWER_028791 [Ataeniobius toweri]|uniref:Uncharacterized protein n=1 Tax=Ataeniobius toweri TaxID=208326 RepID=A0ABU7BWU0_9TELE|nr:hypothetical protein [Ataeniobius toweri]
MPGMHQTFVTAGTQKDQCRVGTHYIPTWPDTFPEAIGHQVSTSPRHGPSTHTNNTTPRRVAPCQLPSLVLRITSSFLSVFLFAMHRTSTWAWHLFVSKSTIVFTKKTK